MNDNDWIEINKNPKHTSRERKKAKDLRNTSWWNKQLGKGLCYYCGNKFSDKQLTMDHIVPISRGGKSNKGNCVVSCKSCNNDKSFLTPAEIILKELDKKLK
tara:strand:+ start:124 stop:429 length:306 start_codon:yes stop_codon:yes gene_type:complete